MLYFFLQIIHFTIDNVLRRSRPEFGNTSRWATSWLFGLLVEEEDEV